MKKYISVAITGLLLAGSGAVSSEQTPDPDRACRQALTRLWPQWRFPEVTAEVRDWAHRYKYDPTAAYGDFDGDGIKDVAYLVQTTDIPRSPKIAACLSGTGYARPFVVDKPYCSDGIVRVSKGQPYHDFEKDLRGTYPQDGVHAYCFEKAGATYLFVHGVIQRIIDSD